MQILKNSGFIDVFERVGQGSGYTSEFLGGKYRTDFILVRGSGVKPLSARRIMDKAVYSVYPSKRFGVQAIIKFS